MKVWQDWRDYRRFQKLPSRDRNIVFYSETHQDWHHLQPLIDFLIDPLGRTVCHVTSEPDGAPAHAVRRGPSHLPYPLQRALHLALPDPQGRRDGPHHARPPQLPAQAIDPSRALLLRVPQHGQHAHGGPREFLRPLREPAVHGPASRDGAPPARRAQGPAPKHIFPYGYPRLERLVEVADAHRKDPSAPHGASRAHVGRAVDPARMWGAAHRRPPRGRLPRHPPPSLSDGAARPSPRRQPGDPVQGAPAVPPRGPDGGERVSLRLRSPDQRLVGHGHRVRAGLRQAGALRRRSAAGAKPEVRGARPGADGDADPPRARSHPASRPRGRGAELRGEARERRTGIPRAMRGPPRGVDVQLRAERGGGAREIARIAAEQEGIGSRGTPIGAARPPGAR